MAKLREVKQKMISLMDLTTLDKDSDTEEKVRQLVALGTDNALETSVAAVCVYPEFVLAAKQKASESPAKSLHVATVVNFPSGDEDLESVQKGAKMALDSGADEIDLVICYREYLETASKGEATSARSCELIQSLKDLIERTKAKGQSCCLKVILETGELKAPELIRKASQDALENGADFLKTSTGKTPNGASLEAARVMLQAIKDFAETRPCGLKISGGVRTFEDALSYMKLVEEMLPSSFLQPETFRFGVSGLLINLLREDVDVSGAY